MNVLGHAEESVAVGAGLRWFMWFVQPGDGVERRVGVHRSGPAPVCQRAATEGSPFAFGLGR